MEQYSNAQDCAYLAKYLKRNLAEKVRFINNVHKEVVEGMLYFFPYEAFDNYREYEASGIPFTFKYLKNEFLRFDFFDEVTKHSLEEKLLVIKMIVSILHQEVGSPTLLFTTKDDPDNTLHVHWAIAKKEETIRSFKDGSAIDDALIDKVILFEDNKQEKLEDKNSSIEIHTIPELKLERKKGLNK